MSECSNPRCATWGGCANPNHKEMAMWKQYKRKGLSEMRPYIVGENLSGISVSEEDSPMDDMGMIARNPNNHKDQWYVARQYFEDNLEEVKP